MSNKATPRDPLGLLRHYWGYDNFRPKQHEIITSVLDGHDTLGLLPTGGGKSLTFQVPALALDGLTIVITPLISLMKDQVDNLARVGIKATCLHSGLTRAEYKTGLDRCRYGKVRLLYISPEKLQSESFIAEMRTLQVSLIVVDEAHCISQWGYDFRPSYLKINSLRSLFPDVAMLALTASATPEVVDDICRRLDFRPGYNVYRRSFARDNISYIVREDPDKEGRLLRVLESTHGSAIVYVRSRRRTREIAERLADAGFTAGYYHAGLDPVDKTRRQEEWKSGQTRVIVATNAFGMGIDKPDVRVVVHMDPPLSLEEYYQEAGRAGRDGNPAFAVLIVSRHDKGRLTRAITESFPPRDYIGHVYEMAGNYVNVAVGSGYNRLYEFNTPLFLKTFNLQPRPALSALRLLTQAGYIEYMEEVSQQSRVMMTATKEALYHIDTDAVTEHLLNTLLRSYTGLFADFVFINEELLAINSGLRVEQVYESLLRLSRLHALQYIPHKTTPYILYTTSREETRYIEIPRTVYEEQRERLERRVKAMSRYTFADATDTDCRVNLMLRYFGEKTDTTCGHCDLCRDRLANRRNKPASDTLRQSILYMTGQQPRTIDYLARESGQPADKIVDTVRDMAEHDMIALSPDGIVYPISHSAD